jgi:hypothetical protein
MTGFATDKTVCARTLLLSAGLALGMATTAQASTVTLETGFSGTIGALGGADPNISANVADFDSDANGYTKVLWGSGNGTTFPVPRNSLKILGGTNSVDFGVGGGNIFLGALDYTNTSVTRSGGIWTLGLNFTVNLDSGGESVTRNQSITVEVENTTDPIEAVDNDPASIQSAANANNAAGTAPDFITDLLFGANAFGAPIEFANGLKVTGFYFGLLDDGQCGTAAANANTIGSTFDDVTGTWENCEGNTSRLGIYASVSYDKTPPPSVIPLPAAGWLLLGGLAALGAAARRRRAA